jgi:hypothetical protein
MPGYIEIVVLVLMVLYCAHRVLVVCRRSSHRRKLVAFYKQHNPSKVHDVDKVLSRYVGQEALLFEDLERKYRDAGVGSAAAFTRVGSSIDQGGSRSTGGRTQRRVL